MGVWLRMTAFVVLLFPGLCTADEADQAAASRLLTALVRNPRFGTTFDRVFSWHSDRGSLREFRAGLQRFADPSSSAAAAAPQTGVGQGAEYLELPENCSRAVALLLAGMVELRSAAPETAEQLLQQALSIEQRHVSYWYLGRAQFQLQRPAAAAEAFESALQRRLPRTDLLDIYREYARGLQRAGMGEESLQVWQRLEEQFPDDRRTLELIANALRDEGRWAEAQQRYAALSRSADVEAEVQMKLASAEMLVRLGRDEEAVTLLTETVVLTDPQGWLHRQIRGQIEQIFRGRGDVDGLIEYYANWLRDHSDDVEVLSLRGAALQDEGRGEEAVQTLRRAAELAPSSESVTNALLSVLTRQQRPAEVAELYERLQAAGRMSDQHWLDWGSCCLRRPDLSDAERRLAVADVCSRLVQTDPENAEVMSLAAAIARRADQEELALEYHRRAHSQAPESVVYCEALGEQLFQMGREQEAQAVWEQLAAGERRTSENLALLAAIQQRHDLTESALRWQREACQSGGDFGAHLRLADMLERAWSEGRAEAAEAGAGMVQEQLLEEALNVLEQSFELAVTADQRSTTEQRQLRVLLLGDRLDREIERLELALADVSPADLPGQQTLRWKLSGCLLAVGRHGEAVDLCQRMLEQERDSLAIRSRLLEIHETSGSVQAAIEVLTELSELDGRNRVRYLQQLARLQLQLGRTAAAIRTAEGVTEAAPGLPSSWQFLADTAFEAGDAELAVAALQRSVRLHPEDESALRALAATLAEQFRTAEAIELYWKALDIAPSADARETLLATLTQLAMRADQLDVLFDRIEQRGRLLRDEERSLRELAVVQRESGSFSAAAATLERLLSGMPAETELIEQLVELSVRRHDRVAGEGWLLQLWERRPQLSTLRRLLQASASGSKRFSAAELIQQFAERSGQRDDIHAAIQLAEESGLSEVAVELGLRQCRVDRSDWWTRDRLLTLADAFPERVIVKDLAFEIVRSGLSLTTSAAGVPTVRDEPGVHPSELLKRWKQDLPLQPRNFGDACARAIDDQIRRAGVTAIAELLAEADAVSAMTGPLVTVMVHWRKNPPLQEAAVREALSRQLAGLDTTEAVALRLELLADILRSDDRPQGAEHRRQLERLLADLYFHLLRQDPQWLSEFCEFDPRLLITEVRTELQQSVAELAGSPQITPEQFVSLLRLATAMSSPQILEALLQTELLRTSDPAIALKLLHAVSGESAAAIRRIVMTKETALQFMGQVLDCVVNAGEQVSVTLLTVDNPQAIRFRQKVSDSGPLEQLISELLTHLQGLNTASGDVLLQSLEQAQQHQDAGIRKLVRAEILRQRGEELRLLEELAGLREVLPEKQLLELWIADRLVLAELHQQALQILQRSSGAEPEVQIAVQQLLLETSLLAGQRDTAEAAASRLIGLPLDNNGLSGLLPVLDRAGFDSLTQSLEVRLGRGTETRLSVLNRRLESLQRAGERQLAGEVAWEILRLSSGGNLFSGYRPNDDLDDGGERYQSLQVLGELGRLTLLRQRYEEMLEESPDSVELLEVLCELHEASGEAELLEQRRNRLNQVNQRLTAGLRDRAVELEREGAVAAACELYLQLFAENPAAFGEQLETFYQAFERADLRAPLVERLLDADSEVWRGQSRLLISAAVVLESEEGRSDLATRVMQMLLSDPNSRRLAIATALNHAGLVSAETIVAALHTDLLEFAGKSGGGSATFRIEFGEIVRLLERIPTTTLREQVLQFLVTDREQMRYLGQALEMLLQLQRENRTAAAAASAGVMAAAAAEVAAGGEVRERYFSVLVVLQESIAGFPTAQHLRREILEFLVQTVPQGSEFQDLVSIELASLYDGMGERRLARDLLLRRTGEILQMQGRSSQPDSVRRILQTAEQIQHSGYPIEAAGLLLSVTDADLQRFAGTLGEDKAIAFRSRWNASRRWSLRQLTPPRLLEWLELQVDELTANGAALPCDMLLEISGHDGPATADREQLLSLRLQSLLVTAALSCQLSDDEQRERFRSICLRLQSSGGTAVSSSLFRLALLGHCVARASSLAAEQGQLAAIVQRFLDHAAEQAPPLAVERGIAMQLRTLDQPLLVSAAASLSVHDGAEGLAAAMLRAGIAGNSEQLSESLRLAVLNEAVYGSERLGLTALRNELGEQRDEILRAWGAGTDSDQRQRLMQLAEQILRETNR